MKTMAFISFLLVSLMMSNPTFAGEGERPPHGGMKGPGAAMGMRGIQDPERMVAHISRWLELDDEQTQELTNVVLAAKPQLMALRERTRANHEAITALDGNDSDYGAKIHSLAAESGQVATEMTLLVSQLRVDIRAKLTEEQRQKLTEGADRMRQRRDGIRRAPGGDTEQ